KPFCCGQFLKEFQPVSIKMAKTQGLSLNPAKISGTCGRLMCCLKYEQHAYEDAVKRCPKQESFVETPDGVGTVTAVNLLRERVKVNLENSDDNSPKTYPVEEISVVRSGKGKRPEGYVAPPPEQLAKLRKAAPPEEEQVSAAAPPAAVAQAPSGRKSSVQPPRAKKKPKQTQKPKLGKGASGAQEGKREDKAVPPVKKNQ
ncbi:MAG: hypothetical protein LUB63_02145, partial [Oscillospiraceae bacterium]|nr:hypothetical protein [Oscillospiraceae bacterium]